MIRMILFTAVIALTGFSVHADSIVDKFECTEKNTSLRLMSVVTNSSSHPYKFFVSVESSTKVKTVLEARSVSGFDYDTMESIYGYIHNSSAGEFLYEEMAKGKRVRRVLTVKMPNLTGDRKSHTLTCKAL